jgi:uncharacterized protein (DUF924 family)
LFTYMPCMHAENEAMVRVCLRAFEELNLYDWIAQDHLDILLKFGRYPYRNEIVGRESTKEEEEWIEWNKKTKRYDFALIKKKT